MKNVKVSDTYGFALVGHSGDGKTSLGEALLHAAGATQTLGRVDDGSSTLNHLPEEKERRHTITSSVYAFDVGPRHVTLVDTRGKGVDRITERKDDDGALPMERVPCPNLWYHAYVFWDGTLVSCERDFDTKTPLGNVRDGVLAAWNGPGMQALRRKHVEGDFEAPACVRCTEWSWWQPSVWHSKGTAPKVDAYAQDAP